MWLSLSRTPAVMEEEEEKEEEIEEEKDYEIVEQQRWWNKDKIWGKKRMNKGVSSRKL